MGHVSVLNSWRDCAIESRYSPSSCDARDISIGLTLTAMDITTTITRSKGANPGQEVLGDRHFLISTRFAFCYEQWSGVSASMTQFLSRYSARPTEQRLTGPGP